MRFAPWLLLAGLAGCSDYDLVTWDGVDVYTQEPPEAVDILLIVDNSGSMQPYQADLSGSFDTFIQYFVGANVDYHIAITTTDDGTDDLTNGLAGRFVDDTIITPETEDPADVFSDLVRVGTSGTGTEMGLKTAYLALTEPLISGANEGFLRDDAALSVIFVSDEEDSSPWPVNDYINGFFEIKGHRDRGVFNASALTVTDERDCTASEAQASTPGDRYVDVASQTHGLIANLCDDDFDHIVTDLSLNASRLTNVFQLTKDPNPNDIHVTVESEGVETDVPCDSGDWTYDRVDVAGEDVPAVIFDLANIPPVGSRISIRYSFGSGEPSEFCTGSAE